MSQSWLILLEKRWGRSRYDLYNQNIFGSALRKPAPPLSPAHENQTLIVEKLL